MLSGLSLELAQEGRVPASSVPRPKALYQQSLNAPTRYSKPMWEYGKHAWDQGFISRGPTPRERAQGGLVPESGSGEGANHYCDVYALDAPPKTRLVPRKSPLKSWPGRASRLLETRGACR